MKKFKLKKEYYYIGGIALFLLAVLLGVFIITSNSTDGAKFKKEYEKLNGEKTSSGNVYQTLNIKKKNKVKYITLKEAVEIVDKGTGIVYFGMPNCPWCRELVPILLEKLDCSCIENLYYVDMSEERNTYEITDEEPVETKKASNEYYELLDLMSEYLDDYTITDSEGVEHVLPQKRIYLPFLVAVKDGQIIEGHTGTVDLEDNQSPYDELNETQKSEVEVIINKMIDGVTKEQTTCEDHC